MQGADFCYSRFARTESGLAGSGYLARTGNISRLCGMGVVVRAGNFPEIFGEEIFVPLSFKREPISQFLMRRDL